VPAVPPELQPVPLDAAAVAEAVGACQRAVGLVTALAEARAHAAARARLEWRGPSREEFDHSTRRLDDEAVELLADLARTIATISGAAGAIVVENRRRTDRREAWARANHLPT
jgi:hypothetical protein